MVLESRKWKSPLSVVESRESFIGGAAFSLDAPRFDEFTAGSSGGAAGEPFFIGGVAGEHD